MSQISITTIPSVRYMPSSACTLSKAVVWVFGDFRLVFNIFVSIITTSRFGPETPFFRYSALACPVRMPRKAKNPKSHAVVVVLTSRKSIECVLSLKTARRVTAAEVGFSVNTRARVVERRDSTDDDDDVTANKTKRLDLT